MKRSRNLNRKFYIYAFILLISAIYLMKLFYIQVLTNKYVILSEKNSSRIVTIFPPRAVIYDRNGAKLVTNEPAYDLMVTPKDVKEFDTIDLCSIIGLPIETVRKRLREITAYSRMKTSIFEAQISKEIYGVLQERMYKFAGFHIQNRSIRSYSRPIGAQILGYVGEVDQKDIDKDKYYKSGDYIGKSGIEKSYEDSIRGIKGEQFVFVDVHNRQAGHLSNGEFDTPSIQGNDIICTIEANLQELGELLMLGKKGSIVAIEPATGEILALISSPTYDPNLLIGRERGVNYKKLVTDKDKPMFGRATQAQYSPGSTFKPLQALVALEMGAITPSSAFPCSGKGSSPIKCTHSHGSPVSMVNGIEQSCNPYFWHIYRCSLEKGGGSKLKENYNEWRDHVMSFGYGKRFESDIPNQVSGNVPSEKYYNKIYGDNGWRPITIRSNSIGQGEVMATPLQMANLMAVIANNGYYIAPHVVRGDRFTEKHYATIDAKHFAVVQEGLARVCDFGTGRHYKVDGVTMAGKTGTVQNSHGKDHSVFIAYAPREAPKIAVAVVVENAGFGATHALPIASLMIEQYLTDTVKRTELLNTIKERVINTTPADESSRQ